METSTNEITPYEEFKDLPDTSTPIYSEVLNEIQKLIKKEIGDNVTNLSGQIGNLANLSTNNKESIVNAINELLNTYSYNLVTDGPPVKTGRKIDGKDEYVKRVDFGDLPASGAKSVSAGLDLSAITIIKADAMPRSSGDVNPLPFSSAAGIANQIAFYFRASNNTIEITTGGLDRSMYSVCVDIYYINN